MGNFPAKPSEYVAKTEGEYLSPKRHDRPAASVSVSHHPADREVVSRVCRELEAEGRSVLVRSDDHEPEVTPELLDAAHRAIELQDVFVAVVSPAFASSELCQWELEHAVRCGKRIVPVEAADMSERANSLHWALTEVPTVFLTRKGDFESGLKLLRRTLDRDLEHLREHTLLLQRAVAWESIYARHDSLLLRGEDKRRAASFLNRAATGTAPFPCALVLRYAEATFQRTERSLLRRGDSGQSLGVARRSAYFSSETPPGTHASVFVSFAPEDSSFAEQLIEAMRQRHPTRRVYAHFEERSEEKEALDRVHSDIQEADTFVFVISSDSLTSEHCGWDMDYAVRCKKRVVPVVARQVDLRTIRAELAEVRWIFFEGGLGSFETCVRLVSQRCDANLRHLQYHSRMLAFAVLWVQNKRHPRHLLRGDDVATAVDFMLTSAMGLDPFPTELHVEYVTACTGKASLWVAARVPEVEALVDVPEGRAQPVLCREEWRLEVVAKEAYVREEAADAAEEAALEAASAASAASSDREVSVMEPVSSASSLSLASAHGRSSPPSGQGAAGAAAAPGPEAEDEDEAHSGAVRLTGHRASLHWAPVITVPRSVDAFAFDEAYGDEAYDPENEEAQIEALADALDQRARQQRDGNHH